MARGRQWTVGKGAGGAGEGGSRRENVSGRPSSHSTVELLWTGGLITHETACSGRATEAVRGVWQLRSDTTAGRATPPPNDRAPLTSPRSQSHTDTSPAREQPDDHSVDREEKPPNKLVHKVKVRTKNNQKATEL